MSTNGNTSYRKSNTSNAPNHRLVDGVSDVYAPTPTDGSIIAWKALNTRWENTPGFGSYFKSGYVDMDATCSAWNNATHTVRLWWAQAGGVMVLFIPATTYASVPFSDIGPVTFTTDLPNYLWPAAPVVDHKLGMNLDIRADTTVLISTTGSIVIYKGHLYGTLASGFNPGGAGEACGGNAMYVPYRINFVAGSSGPIVPSPIPVMKFTDLNDTQAVYSTPYSLLRVKSLANGVSEFDMQATLPAINQFKLTQGTTNLTATTSCTLDQNLATTSSPQFASPHFTGSPTIDGNINFPDPGANLIRASVNVAGNYNQLGLYLKKYEAALAAHDDVKVYIDSDNNSVDKKFAVMANGDPAGGTVATEKFSVVETGAVNVTNTITSSFTTSPAKILDFSTGGTAGNYSYLGNSVADCFGVMRGSGCFISSDTGISFRLKTTSGAINVYNSASGPGLSGTRVWTLYEDGHIQEGRDVFGTHHDKTCNDGTLASADQHAITTEYAVKTYVDSMFSTGSFTATMTGSWAAPHDTTVYYSRSGGNVTMVWNPATYTNTGTGGIAITGIPAAIRPTHQGAATVLIQDNNIISWGKMIIATDGSAAVSKADGAAFTVGTESGIKNCYVSYTIS